MEERERSPRHEHRRTPAPAGVSFPLAPCERFQRIEARSVRLPTDAHPSRFGTVSDRFHSQALSRLSWLSYSPPNLHSVADGQSGPPVPLLPELEAPHVSQVDRALRGFHPNALRPYPPGQDSHGSAVATCFNTCGQRASCARSVSVAPHPRGDHRIELADCSA